MSKKKPEDLKSKEQKNAVPGNSIENAEVETNNPKIKSPDATKQIEHTPEAKVKNEKTLDFSQAENIVEVKGLKKAFGKNEVLKNIDFTIRKGENVVVLGRSGQGKSVTIKCMVGLLKPDEGYLDVLGSKVDELSEQPLKELREKIGFLFQGGALYDSMSVRENLEFPLRRVRKMTDVEEIDRLVNEMLENVGLSDAIDKMPSDLSGGMKKRIGLARTLILKPELMLYDEPTTGLDPFTSNEISMLILEMQKKYGISSMIITHDLLCARITANRILIMDNGTFIAQGSFDELSHSKDNLIRSFFIQ